MVNTSNSETYFQIMRKTKEAEAKMVGKHLGNKYCQSQGVFGEVACNSMQTIITKGEQKKIIFYLV